MGYLEASLNLKCFGPGAEDDDRDARHAGNGSHNRCRAGAAATTVGFVGGSDIGFLLRLDLASWLVPRCNFAVSLPRHIQHKLVNHLSAASDPPLHYSITSSAMASTPDGMAMPSVLAVWRLMMNSNLTARITGRSAGFSPLSTRRA
jgi:hypothetical protein